MWYESRKKILVISLFFLLACIIAWQYEETTSVSRRAYSWSILTYGTTQSPSETYYLARVLSGNIENTPEVVNSELKKSGIETTVTSLETYEVPLTYSTQTLQDTNFIKDFHYFYPFGQTGVQKMFGKVLLLKNEPISRFTVAGDIRQQPIHEVEFIGSKDGETVKGEILTLWNEFKIAATSKNTSEIARYLTPEEVKKGDQLTSLAEIDYKLDAQVNISFAVADDSLDRIAVGSLLIQQKDCSVAGSIPLVYMKEDKSYRFGNVSAVLASLCFKPKPPTQQSTMLSCKDCWLAPVSKIYGLPSTYSPGVVATGLNGGGYVTKPTKDALILLFADAQKIGLQPRVSSSYRSYKTQETLFNSYVQTEMKTGKLSYEQAVQKANTYSAKPGNSEHQLGTTVDVVGCPLSCSFYDSRSTGVYTFIRENAHKYGFVISYPEGSQMYTGYVYEPWHIRYIGVDRATRLFENGYLTKQGYYLYNFLIANAEF
jgi:LAS superfamily LD-carboxypeptidase LdcB